MIAAVLGLCVGAAQAQSVRLEGRVVASDGAALRGAVVSVLPERRASATTDAQGRFALTVEVLPVEIEARAAGFEPARVRVSERRPVQIVLAEVRTLGEAEVVAPRLRALTDVQGSSVAVRAADVRETPAVLGEPDVLKTLQLLPGVRGGVEGQSGLYVRGGGPDENLVLLDGLPLYGTSHLFGFVSAFPSEVVGEAEVVKGGFPARYAGRLSSVVDVRTRAGAEAREVRVHAGVLAGQVSAEGRVPGGTALVGVRRTFVDLATRTLLDPANALHPSFGDVYGRYDVRLGAGARLVSSVYGSRDRYVARRTARASDGGRPQDTPDDGLVLTEDVGVGWTNGAASARLLVERPALRAEAGVGGVGFQQTSRQQTSARLGETETLFQDRFATSVRDLRAWGHAARDVTPRLTASGGALATVHTFGAQRAAREAGRDERAVEGGAYGEAETEAGPLRVAAGLHGAVYSFGGQTWASAQPRLRARVLAGRTAVRASYARTVQPVHGVVNLIDGLPVEAWLPATPEAPPSRADQVTLGAERQLGTVGWSVEAYAKRSRGVLTRREGVARVRVGDAWEADVAAGRATSIGVETFVEKRAGRWTGWLGYTLARVRQRFDAIDDGRPFPSRFDRRHDVSVVARFQRGPRTSLHATFVYGTGDAVTLANATYAGCISPDGRLFSGCNFVASLGPRNGSRLPAYHRLDLGYRFTRASGRAAFSAGVYNAYGQPNPFRVDLTTGFNLVGNGLVGGDIVGGGLVVSQDRLDASVLLPFVPYVHYEVRL